MIGVTALWLWFYSMSLLPLATAMTLNYMSSIWMAAMLFVSGWWRGHGRGRFEWGLVAAIVMLSFIGVTLLLQPSFQSGAQWFGGHGCARLRHVGRAGLSAGAPSRPAGRTGIPRGVLFFRFVRGLRLARLRFSARMRVGAPAWHAHSAQGIALLLTVGMCATTAQIAMTRAYRLGNPLISANLQYSGIVFSTVWGMLIWSDMH